MRRAGGPDPRLDPVEELARASARSSAERPGGSGAGRRNWTRSPCGSIGQDRDARAGPPPRPRPWPSRSCRCRPRRRPRRASARPPAAGPPGRPRRRSSRPGARRPRRAIASPLGAAGLVVGRGSASSGPGARRARPARGRRPAARRRRSRPRRGVGPVAEPAALVLGAEAVEALAVACPTCRAGSTTARRAASARPVASS